MSDPQYYKNTLDPVPIDPSHLRSVLKDLRTAVHRGADLVREGVPPCTEWPIAGIFIGVSGVALAFLRLAHQAPALVDEGIAPPLDFHQLALERIVPHGPDLPIQANRLAPSGSPSPLTGTLLRILEAAASGRSISNEDIELLRETVDVALKTGHLTAHGDKLMGADEPLYGRAGLLWVLLNIRERNFDAKTTASLAPILESIPLLVDKIILSGREGHDDFISRHGKTDAFPLAWPWMQDRYALGAIHGMAGVLATLLACRSEEINDGASRNHLPWIAECITILSKICIKNNGHIPATIPPHDSLDAGRSPLVQICHGSPGMLLLLAMAMQNTPLISDFWDPQWDEAARLAGERIWEEGLLPKGGGICHGISGNAWSLLYAHNAYEFNAESINAARRNYMQRTQSRDLSDTAGGLSGDYFLSRVLAMLLHVRETPPYQSSPRSGANLYRLPDRPFSLTEGLSGAVCAWAETCIVIQARLRKMELEKQTLCAEPLQNDAVFQKLESLLLGFPAVAYHRPTGFF